MKQTKNLTLIALCVLMLNACKKEVKPLDNAITQQGNEQLTAGMSHVFVLSNQVAGNDVISYNKAADGTLSFVKKYPTGGTGTGTGLGNQGAICLSGDRSILIAVNAGDNSISSMRVTSTGLKLLSHVASEGITPVSVTMYGNLVYVLNASGTGNIAAFKVDNKGMLSAIPNGTKALSSTAAGAAQISFLQDGKVVVVTEKATNTITSYMVEEDGTPGAMNTVSSANATPFGFAVGRNNVIYVSEAAGGSPGASTLSSYYVGKNGRIKLISGPVHAYQSSACWTVLTKNGKYAYTTNTGSNNISSFKVTAYGNINIAAGIAAAAGTAPADAAVTADGNYMYILNSGSQQVSGYSVAEDGSILSIQFIDGLPVGATGMVAD